MAEWLPYLPVLIVLTLMARRTRVPRIIRPQRLWLSPALLLAFVALYVFVAVQQGVRLDRTHELIVLAGGLGGIGVGALRASWMHLDLDPATGQVQARMTAWGFGFMVFWIGGRIALRRMGLLGAAEPFGVFTDTALALAIGAVMARTLVLARRCTLLASARSL
jgi:hypothetical protein